MSDPVTPREQEVVNALHALAGKGRRTRKHYDLVASAMGIKASAVERYNRRAHAKGAIPGGKAAVKAARGLENVAPRKAAEALDRATEPVLGAKGYGPTPKRIEAIAHEMRLPVAMVEEMLRRLDRKDQRLSGMLRQVKLENLRDLLSTRAEDFLLAITEGDLLEASLRDKMFAAGEALKYAMLLQGLPTAIIRDERDRGLMVKAMSMFALEAARRGLQIPAPEEKEIHPTPTPSIATPSGTTLEVSP